jgi:hypothetical protein
MSSGSTVVRSEPKTTRSTSRHACMGEDGCAAREPWGTKRTERVHAPRDVHRHLELVLRERVAGGLDLVRSVNGQSMSCGFPDISPTRSTSSARMPKMSTKPGRVLVSATNARAVWMRKVEEGQAHVAITRWHRGGEVEDGKEGAACARRQSVSWLRTGRMGAGECTGGVVRGAQWTTVD